MKCVLLTPKIVRARIKPLAMLPEWVTTEECDDFRKLIASLGEFSVDLSDTGGGIICAFCCRLAEAVCVRRLPYENERWIPFELLDLDEGPEAA